MFTICAFSEEVALSTTGEKLTAVPDDHLSTENDNIFVPELNKLMGAYAVGEDIDNPYLASPSLRRMANYDIVPFETDALPAFEPDIPIFPLGKIALVEDEQLTAYADNNNAAAKQESIIVFLSDDDIVQVSGNIYTIKATATAPATSYAWDSADLTLTQELPVGDYQLVGAMCVQANTIAFRFIFIGGAWRPGHIAQSSHAKKAPEGARYGRLGVWGTFHHNKIPRIEFFGDGTGGAAEVYLDLIKIGG
jgi:hypothetical protein